MKSKPCKQCGYIPVLGRPKKIDDRAALALRKKKWSIRAIAKHLHLSVGAVQASLKRTAA